MRAKPHKEVRDLIVGEVQGPHAETTELEDSMPWSSEYFLICAGASIGSTVACQINRDSNHLSVNSMFFNHLSIISSSLKPDSYKCEHVVWT